MKGKLIKGSIVVVSAIVLTTLGIDAADTLQDKSGTMLATLLAPAAPTCPDDMVDIALADKHLCVDRFEAHPGDACPTSMVTNAIDSRANAELPACAPSGGEGSPWVFVSYHQAKELCAKAGKRLPSVSEWYSSALGTPDDPSRCNTSSQGATPGTKDGTCVNAFGVHDAVGNVWEWVDASVDNGTYEGRAVPTSGYVVSADRDGIATLTNETLSSPDMHDDYFWSEASGSFGILRGGFYGSGKDGGLYSVQAKTPLSMTSAAIGFRCVKDRT